MQNHSFEGYAIEGSPRDAMIAILAKSRENEFSGLRKSWGISADSKARGNIRLCVSTAIAQEIKGLTTAHEMWDALET